MLLGSSDLYEHHVILVKDYGLFKRVLYMPVKKKSGYEIPRKKKDYTIGSHYVTEYNPFLNENVRTLLCDDFEDIDFEGKLANNISRARSKVFEYAVCNEWDYFFTMTLNPNKGDRYNLQCFNKDLKEWIKNCNKRIDGFHMRYIMVPEQHKDGAWHFHGLMSGIPETEFEINQYGYLDFPRYAKRFGHISLGKIRDRLAVAIYVTKYITKDLGVLKDKYTHLYYVSQGLKRAKVIAKYENVKLDEIEYDYENANGYVKLISAENEEELQQILEHMVLV